MSERKRGTVLVVDDHEGHRELLSCELEDEGYEVHQAATGELALDRCLTTELDAVVLDIEMPGIDGLETCRRIRKLEIRQPAILFLTGWPSEHPKSKAAVSAGGDVLIEKSVALPIMITKLSTFIATHRAGRLVANL